MQQKREFKNMTRKIENSLKLALFLICGNNVNVAMNYVSSEQ